MGLSSKLGHFRTLSSAERRVLLLSALMLPCVDVELRLRGWCRCHARLAAWAKRPPTAASWDTIPPQRIAWLVERAAQTVPWPATCLRRSLVLWALLARAGTRADLRLGFRKTDGRFEAHAWVELAGVPLNDRLDVSTRYTVADRSLSPGDWAEA